MIARLGLASGTPTQGGSSTEEGDCAAVHLGRPFGDPLRLSEIKIPHRSPTRAYGGRQGLAQAASAAFPPEGSIRWMSGPPMAGPSSRNRLFPRKGPHTKSESKTHVTKLKCPPDTFPPKRYPDPTQCKGGPQRVDPSALLRNRLPPWRTLLELGYLKQDPSVLSSSAHLS